MRSPSTRVTWPTSTPGTSVIASKRPGVPTSNGMPRSRARGEALSWAAAVAAPRAREIARWRAHIVTGPPVRDDHWLRLDWSDVVEEGRAARSGGVLPLAYGGGRGAHLHERDPLRGNGGEPRRADGQRAPLPRRARRGGDARRARRVRRARRLRDRHHRNAGHGSRRLRHRVRHRRPALGGGARPGDAGEGARLLAPREVEGRPGCRREGRARLEGALPGNHSGRGG